MANIKDVEIRGVLPFDMEDNEEMINLLGQLNMPACGLRVAWMGEAGYELNKHGGRTCMYNFIISGQEAASWDYLDRVIRVIKESGGRVTPAKAADLEDSPKRYVDLIRRTV